MNPLQIVAKAKSLLGIVWRHQGRTRDGLDCVGFIILVLSECGWVPRQPEQVMLAGYERIADSDYVMEVMRGEGREFQNIAELRVGDVVVFQPKNLPFAQHCGIVSRQRADGAFYFIHADNGEGQVIESRLVLSWREQFVAGFRDWESMNSEEGANG